jgi:hypothetical protein
MFGDQCPCGYARKREAVVWRNTEHAMPAHTMPREAFGMRLYRAIELCGGILQLQAAQGKERVQERGAGEAYQKREYVLAQQLAEAYTALSVFEQNQLRGRYPKLFGKVRAA